MISKLNLLMSKIKIYIFISMIRMVRSVVGRSMVATVRRLIVIIVTNPHNLSPAFLLRDLSDLSPGNQSTFLNKTCGAILYWDLGLHLFRKLRAVRLESFLTNLLGEILTASGRDDLCLGLLMFSAHLGRHQLAVLGWLAGVVALGPLQGLALGGHHVPAHRVEDLLLHQHRDGETDSPGHVPALRHGHVLTHHLGDVGTTLLQ